jgi:hypothetical protein
MSDETDKDPYFELYTDAAGRLTLGLGRRPGYLTCIHFGVEKSHRQWGYKQDWYDGPIHSFGLGPLLLVCWF